MPPQRKRRGFKFYLPFSITLHIAAAGIGIYSISNTPINTPAEEKPQSISLGLRAAQQRSTSQQSTKANTEQQEVTQPEPTPEQKPQKKELKKKNKQTESAITQAPTPKSQEVSGKSSAEGSFIEEPSEKETGIGDLNASLAIQEKYDALILTHFKKYKRYPTRAKRLNLEGNAEITFTINRFGEVIDYKISSATRPIFRKATTQQLMRAQPFPPPPAESTWTSRTYKIKVPFMLED